ncbi:hypothetical protein [Prochlorococcus marinus]|uniref:hypothetical protein n=1 Tax=Prochlorococcus marinus TaxID=1219 RepID=UPI0022B3E777|nr:hypothetical protein [Prochlorococcus marinus]
MKKQIYNFLKFKIIFFRLRKKIYSIIKLLFWKVFDHFTKSSILVSPFFGNTLRKTIHKILKLTIKILEYVGFSFFTKRIISRYINIKNLKNLKKDLNIQYSPEVVNSNQIDYESRLLSMYSSSSKAKKINQDLMLLLDRRSYSE